MEPGPGGGTGRVGLERLGGGEVRRGRGGCGYPGRLGGGAGDDLQVRLAPGARAGIGGGAPGRSGNLDDPRGQSREDQSERSIPPR